LLGKVCFMRYRTGTGTDKGNSKFMVQLHLQGKQTQK
jgi:hypothetical protein